jgi:hypothetical protein
MTQRFGAVAALTFAAMAFAPPALATERTYPGLRCVAAFNYLSYGQGKATFNGISGSRAAFLCPISRTTLDGGTFTGVSVWVEVGGDQSLGCSLVSCPSDGGSCSRSSEEVANTDGVHKLTLGSVVKYPDGYAYVTCNVPHRGGFLGRPSGVISYRWDE